MRGKRAKKYKKLMAQYELIGFRQPYQVLLDSALLQVAAAQKMDLVGRLKGVLGGEIKPMISQCDMRHLYEARPKDEALINQAKTYERRRCGHHELEEPLSSLQCISECVDPKDNSTNKHRYVVATQDVKLRARLRRIPGVPLIYINKSVMILEPISEITEAQRNQDEKSKFKAGLKGRRGANAGQKRKRDDDDDTREPEDKSIATQPDGNSRPQKRKRGKGPKGPNPLSVKKPKKQPLPDVQREEAGGSKPSMSDLTPNSSVDTTEAPLPPSAEPEKRKRKRKHKPKGDNGTHLPSTTLVDPVG